MHDLTHASFFSGVGGLDLGLERAGWRTVSFSEIDPYASAVLAERWPGVPNLGDIVGLRSDDLAGSSAARDPLAAVEDRHGQGGRCRLGAGGTATLWSGGFPCQDLSVAGKRAGFRHAGREEPYAGRHSADVEGFGASGTPATASPDDRYADLTRSGLAFAFLDLVERHRPPAILLENVPGLLSSNGGRDFGELLGRLAELGYGWAYRILDAQYFGVPQRRRRVFILAFHSESGLGADSAAEVLSVGSRCDGHSATGDEAGQGVARSIVGSLDTALGHHGGGWPAQSVASGHVVADGQHRPSPDPGGVREADGLAGRMDDNERVVNPILSNAQGGNRTTDLNIPLAFVKAARVNADPDSPESWKEGGPMPTLNSWDQGDIRTTAAVLGEGPADDPMLPLGLDSHRYRCCGNGVVSNVSEWIGVRLAEAMA